MFSLLVIAKPIKVLTTHKVQVLVKRRANKQNIYEFHTITVAAKFLYFFLIFLQKNIKSKETKLRKKEGKPSQNPRSRTSGKPSKNLHQEVLYTGNANNNNGSGRGNSGNCNMSRNCSCTNTSAFKLLGLKVN